MSLEMKRLFEKILAREERISVTGLGYVGLPLAAAFSGKAEVIGYDRDERKIAACVNGTDLTGEVGDEALKSAKIRFTSDETILRDAAFHIVAVPTPVNGDKTPDLTPVVTASETVGRNLKKGSVVVYESTVYPGVTEEICLPILEKTSGLKGGRDFKIGYSPERINPGDKLHRLENIQKIVSGMDGEALDIIASVYSLIIEAGVYRVSSIKTAEAVKIAENSQRDINIAFMNELAMVFDLMGVDTNEVAAAMDTKWNALGFRPGLVGGHCIGVDPYYFISRAEKLGYHSDVILAGRRVNDAMADFVADAAVKKMILAGHRVKGAKAAVLGLTFKENCRDIRNSKAAELVKRLTEYGVEVTAADPMADEKDVWAEYGIKLTDTSSVKDMDCVIFAVAHSCFRETGLEAADKMFAPLPAEEKVLIDVKGIFPVEKLKELGWSYWRL